LAALAKETNLRTPQHDPILRGNLMITIGYENLTTSYIQILGWILQVGGMIPPELLHCILGIVRGSGGMPAFHTIFV